MVIGVRHCVRCIEQCKEEVSMKVDLRKVNWSIQRMRRIMLIWTNLDHADKCFLLSYWRDKEPELFYEIANQGKEQSVCFSISR